jgi:RND family efflux transporter MFP subunit
MAAAEADLRLVRLAVQRCEIRAPFDGTVVEHRVQAGEYVSEGQPVIEVVDHATLELEAIVPSQLLTWLRPGSAFTIEFDELAGTLPARVDRVAPVIDPVSQTVKLYGTVTQGHGALVAGMSGRARFTPPARGH